MKITIVGNRASLPAPVPATFVGVSVQLEGHKAWLKAGGFSFEPTHHNLQTLQAAFPAMEVDDQREVVERFRQGVIQAGQRDPRLGGPTGPVAYASCTQPYGPFQTDMTRQGLETDFYGMFAEQGLGKTKVAVDICGERWCRGEITGVLVIGFNGVHVQWTEPDAIPKHLGEMVPRRMHAYTKGKPVPEWIFKRDKLAWLTISFESVWTKEGRKVVDAFITMHGGRLMCIVDEGQRIKNPDAKSSMEIFEIGRLCRYRMDLTGTPLVKDLTDIWSQFKFLDASVIGHKYKATFRAQYCTMHPKIHGVVTGSKNEQQFYEKIQPYIYRITKAEALPDMPPKIYDRFTFELHPTQRKLYDELKTRFIAELESGKVTSVKNALTLVMRLQQITNGYIALDKDDPDEATQFEYLPNPRMDALKAVLKQRIGKKVVWCRFTKDIELGRAEFNKSSVSYYGGNGRDERSENKRMFIDEQHITELFSNPAVGGTGVDGLQKVARTAIYYSNSYNSVHRWQSEDRIDRIGMGLGSSAYIDLVARNTVDLPILKNLRKKKQLSDLVLDDIRKLFDDEESTDESD